MLVRFALSKLHLNANGTPCFSQVSFTRRAWRSTLSSDSITSGPAITNSGLPSPTGGSTELDHRVAFAFPSRCSTAARMKPEKSGCGSNGLLLNSGWTWQPMKCG